MSGLKSECLKFSPNVFNKSKCQNCFRTKENHSAEALESNRASRKVSKCGYLFIAPDWDFNITENRTKRWQRRWFVLFDDGELTYALDEFPDTVPQGTIDMNQVLDVSDAEGVTGNDFAIAITTADKVHFIKGTSKEESKWWFDVLYKVLPRHVARGKHKRNATFPCGKSIIPSPAALSQDYCSEDDIRVGFSRPKFVSSSSVAFDDRGDFDPAADERVLPAEGNASPLPEIESDAEKNSPSGELLVSNYEGQDNVTSSPDSAANDVHSRQQEIHLRRRNRRLKRENRVQKTRFSGIGKLPPSRNCPSPASLDPVPDSILSDGVMESSEPTHSETTASSQDLSVRGKGEDNTPLNRVVKTNLRKSESLKNIPLESSSEMKDQVSGLRRYHSFRGSSSVRKAKPPSPSSTPKISSATKQPSGPFTRTGWLFRQTLTKEWSRHWFVLKDSSLTYYRDSGFEESGIMDGVLDLNQVSTIRDNDSDKYYAFILSTWDGRKHVLAAETEDLRRTWVQAIRYASNLWSLASKEVFLQNEIVLPEHNFLHAEKVSSPSSLPSVVDDHDKMSETSSSSSDDQSEYFSLVDEDEDILCSIHQDDDIDPSAAATQTACENGQSSSVNEQIWRNHSSLAEYRDLQQDLKLKNSSIQLEEESGNKHGNVSDTLEETATGDGFANPPVGNRSAEECYLCVKMSLKLMAARDEIRKLKAELRDAHSSFDNLEMFSYKLQQDMRSKEDHYNSQLNLMTAKIDDLTSKFTAAEKNYRQLKQKLTKGEYKLERKRSSLKNRDGLSLSKEYESKLSELESKIVNMELNFQKEGQRAESSLLNEQSNSSVVESGESDSCATQTHSAESNKGLLSRLQTLGAKVKHITHLIAEKGVNAEKKLAENPKICIQSRDSEGSSSFDESDDYKTSSLPNNLTSLKNMDNYNGKQSYTSSDIQVIFSQKIDHILEGLKDSFEYLYRPVSSNDRLSNEKSELLTQINEVLDHLYYRTPDGVESLDCRNVYYNMLLLIEVNKAMKRINYFETRDILMKFDVAYWASRVIDETFCVAFVKSKKPEISELVLNLISEIPCIGDFCPIVNKILFQEENEVHNYSTAASKLLHLKDSRLLCLLDSAKETRFLSLWDTFAKIPVQDDEDEISEKTNPLLMHITAIISNIYRTAELELTSFGSQSLYVIKFEYDVVLEWSMDMCRILKQSLGEFVEQLKRRCPLVDESTFDFLNVGDIKLREITALVSELSFFCIASVILDATFSLFSSSDICVPRNRDLFEQWVAALQKNFWYKTNSMENNDFVEHSTHNCMFSNDPKRMNSMDFLRICDTYTKPVDYLKFKASGLQNKLGQGNSCSFETFSEVELNKNLRDDFLAKSCRECNDLTLLLKQKEMELESIKQKCDLMDRRLLENRESHKQEMQKKEMEVHSSLSRLQSLKVEYEEQKENLKNLYEQKLQFEQNIIDKDSVRHYKAEIEDIKDMFKKGLLAIQNSHNHITSELEKRHREEVARLEAEKQKALEMEAQATATALEAIKRFHANQLMEEISTIKEDLLNTHQTERKQEDFLYKYGNELEDLKAEIMNITELYATKCMENFALEEKVDSLCQQLKETHNELHRLLTRSKDADLNSDH